MQIQDHLRQGISYKKDDSEKQEKNRKKKRENCLPFINVFLKDFPFHPLCIPISRKILIYFILWMANDRHGI